MQKYFYRFRSTSNLLERNELIDQCIYFAHPEELNDPMEGYRDIYWKGDKVTWNNFFRHYLLCLEHVCSLWSIGGEKHCEISDKNIPIFISYDDLPTQDYKNLFDDISTQFFINFSNLIDKFCSRTTPVRRNELLFFLFSIHFNAIDIIFETYSKHGLSKKRDYIPYNISSFTKLLCTVTDIIELGIKSGEIKNDTDIIFEIVNSVKNDMVFANRITGAIPQEFKNKNIVFFDFPSAYIKQLEKLIYPQWYAACFMTECESSSVWGHYGNGHNGVCLIFEPDNNNDCFEMKLHGKIGWGGNGPIYGDQNHKFYKIEYGSGFVEIDFFRSIGRLPIPKLISNWYTDKNGIKSKIVDLIFKNEKEWRQSYWDNFLKSIMIKTMDWKYENEYRLILNGLLENEIDKTDRILKYDFRFLKGIIFGINTTMEDKLKIIAILNNKCIENNRKDFELYQAYYSPNDKKIKRKKISFTNLGMPFNQKT